MGIWARAGADCLDIRLGFAYTPASYFHARKVFTPIATATVAHRDGGQGAVRRLSAAKCAE
jgi:hypothetical protein